MLQVLGELEDSDLQWLAEAGRLRAVAAGTELIREDRPLDSVYIVLDGELAASVHGAEVARLGAGEIVGEMSLVDPRPTRVATVGAVEDSTLFAVAQETLRAKLAADAEFAARFYRALCIFLVQRLSRADAMLVGKASATPRPPQDDTGELSGQTLKNTALAGARFRWFVDVVRGA